MAGAGTGAGGLALATTGLRSTGLGAPVGTRPNHTAIPIPIVATVKATSIGRLVLVGSGLAETRVVDLVAVFTGALTTVVVTGLSPLTAAAKSSIVGKRCSGSLESARSSARLRSRGVSGRTSMTGGGGSKTCL